MKKIFSNIAWSLCLMMASLLLANPAIAAGKKTIEYIYSDNCRACVSFERKMLSDPQVQAELKRFNFKKIHASQVPPRDNLMTPTIVIYDSKHRKIREFIPVMNKNKFLQILREN